MAELAAQGNSSQHTIEASSDPLQAFTNFTNKKFALLLVDIELLSPAELELFKNIRSKYSLLIFTLASNREVDALFVRDNGSLRKIVIDEIDYIEAMGDYVKIFTGTKFYLARTKLQSIQEKIPCDRFLKVHRSFIIALNKIDRIEEGKIIINQKSIPVADGYRAVLNSRLHIL
jgi:DNA-binding LytR/AlgR family response regulator